jgi:hypothetical protein
MPEKTSRLQHRPGSFRVGCCEDRHSSSEVVPSARSNWTSPRKHTGLLCGHGTTALIETDRSRRPRETAGGESGEVALVGAWRLCRAVAHHPGHLVGDLDRAAVGRRIGHPPRVCRRPPSQGQALRGGCLWPGSARNSARRPVAADPSPPRCRPPCTTLRRDRPVSPPARLCCRHKARPCEFVSQPDCSALRALFHYLCAAYHTQA